MNDEQPKFELRQFNKYYLIGLKLDEHWMQPIRAVYRDRSKYKPVTNQIVNQIEKEKETDV